MTQVRVRVRDKHQITLPASVVRAANVGVNDVLEVSCKDGAIVLSAPRVKEKKRPCLMDLAGSTKGLYGNTTEERQAWLAGERKSWER
jgi:bifunctional DNA-binding transcriptional regulator/antitoxin component of YhaV-PrlF toxin-antitoxin module